MMDKQINKILYLNIDHYIMHSSLLYKKKDLKDYIKVINLLLYMFIGNYYY